MKETKNKTGEAKPARRLYAMICSCCGEVYSLRHFSRQNPLEVCGECGSEYFLPYSRDCLKGFRSIEHYYTLVDLLPARLRPHIPPELSPQLSPFRN